MCEFNPGQRERNSPKDSLETFWGGCAGSLMLLRLSLATASRGYSSCGARASHGSGFSCSGAQAQDEQAQ